MCCLEAFRLARVFFPCHQLGSGLLGFLHQPFLVFLVAGFFCFSSGIKEAKETPGTQRMCGLSLLLSHC